MTVTLSPEVIDFLQWLINQGVGVAVAVGAVFYVGKKLDEGNRVLSSLTQQLAANTATLTALLAELGKAPPR